MSSFKDVYLTKRGTQLLARSVTEGLRLEFTKMVTGNGIYSEEERTKASLLERTELKSQKQEFGFSSVAVAESNIIKLKAMVTNIGLTEGYRITEIGIVARLEGKTEEEPILYSIAVAEEADYLPSQETPISYIQEYYTKISNAENIIINLEMGSYALAEDMQSVLKPQFKENEEIENIESGESIFSIFAKIKRAIRGLIEHKTSGDHDSRYYTEAEMDGKLSGKSDTTHNHDGRYLQKSAVINSNTVTETGYALDARQANPNVSGSLGAQINSLNKTLKNKITGQSDNIVIYGGTWLLYGVSNQIYTNVIDISDLGLSNVISVIAQPDTYPSFIHVTVSIASAKSLNVQTFKDATGNFYAHFIIIGAK